MSVFRKKTVDQHAKSLGQYMPNDETFCSKNIEGSVLIRFLKGFSGELKRVSDLIVELVDQHDINNTVDLISEWESAVGIPDDCFIETESLPLEERRRQVLTKIFMRRTYIKSDYITLANILIPGVQIQIRDPAPEIFFPLTFPLEFSLEAEDQRYVMRVHLSQSLNPDLFKLPFPLPFSTKKGNIIECVFNNIKPAYTRIDFFYDL